MITDEDIKDLESIIRSVREYSRKHAVRLDISHNAETRILILNQSADMTFFIRDEKELSSLPEMMKRYNKRLSKGGTK